MTQTIVMAMETEVVMQPLQRVTEVLVLQTMDVISSVASDATLQGQNSTRPAAHGVQGYQPEGSATVFDAAITTA